MPSLLVSTPEKGGQRGEHGRVEEEQNQQSAIQVSTVQIEEVKQMEVDVVQQKGGSWGRRTGSR